MEVQYIEALQRTLSNVAAVNTFSHHGSASISPPAPVCFVFLCSILLYFVSLCFALRCYFCFALLYLTQPNP